MPTDGPDAEPVVPFPSRGTPAGRDGAAWPPDATAGEALRHMIEAGLAELLSHREAALAGEVEGVHQARVAIRRLRAVLGTFRPLLPEEVEARFRASLGGFARVLGEARDWDVFIAGILPAAAVGGVPIQELARLDKAARRARAAAQKPLRTALGGSRFANMLAGLAAWAEDAADTGSPAGEGPLARPAHEVAPRLQKRLLKRTRRRGRHIHHRAEDELHELRKALKKLRYEVEMLAPLHRGRRKRFRAACKDLQEHLGGLNDAVVAAGLTRRLETEDPSIASEAEALRAWTQDRLRAEMASVPKAWRRFRKQKAPRLAA